MIWSSSAGSGAEDPNSRHKKPDRRYIGKYGQNGKLKAWIEMEQAKSFLWWGVSGDGKVFQMWYEDLKRGSLYEGGHVFLSKWEVSK